MKYLFNILTTLALVFTTTFVFAAEPIATDPAPSAGETLSLSDTNTWERLRALNSDAEPTIWKAACCKVCRKGKACGNSCISRSYTCRKGPGCACDG